MATTSLMNDGAVVNVQRGGRSGRVEVVHGGLAGVAPGGPQQTVAHVGLHPDGDWHERFGHPDLRHPLVEVTSRDASVRQ